MDDIDDIGSTGGRLIAASQVSGTTVFDQAGSRIGTIEDIVLNKQSGRTAFAVLSFGGFLGIGDKHHPLPWNSLKYDEGKGGYVVDISREQLQGGPAYGDNDTLAWDDAAWGKRINDYYGPRI